MSQINRDEPQGDATTSTVIWCPLPNTEYVWCSPGYRKMKMNEGSGVTGLKPTTMNRQVGGDHYLKYKIPIIDFIVQNKVPFREANIIKYVLRAPDKAGLQDLLKAKHYLEMLINDYDN